ncbi:hypothetical protein [Rathayibacter iranicus]|uniref:Bulb-type lectin domain-containing protein n=2 Tax=Rathayibacter iranicus TaxID=59737 RepID=A0AAD1AFG2_9MICO|nr:hypothetical protein [Rathayibacter iranicus]AZZ56482.1 hypothetical protein C7V51_11790 [Rathayibacter iranicus]MWV31867.1 hypothetical protein [Rathayibacter iranicus NCPPB 2253 = VKM Ac-1602]PPI44818.1 hypothetical protein C5E09_10505 [Rathayibacter iranicus]PPI59026.1 hypothetical protein C5E08_11645 [Rathayibacter iranicus]PPI70030.1 hypothetical protein C5E01_10700 [Rathayibacter iranicus]
MTPSLSRPFVSGLAALALTGSLLAGAAPAFATTSPLTNATAAAATAADPAALSSGQQLAKGQSVVSASGAVRFVLQDDGNAVVYSTGGATWSSGTQARGDRLVMQTDGNLVIYDSTGRPVWFTGTNDPGSILRIQDDANLVVYRSTGTPAWASSVNGRITAPDDPPLESGATLTAGQQLTAGPERAEMQTDGNFVLYGPQGTRWFTGTSGAGNRLVMQTDGNAVVYGADGSVKWASGTVGNPGAEMRISSSGLVISSPRGLVWTSISQTRRDTLQHETTLISGDQLTSASGAWRAIMQGDGNFVVYGPRGADWSTGTSIPGSDIALAADGYLVVYARGTQEGEGHWDSSPELAFSTSPFRVVMQNDGNLVEYDANDRVIWASRA